MSQINPNLVATAGQPIIVPEDVYNAFLAQQTAAAHGAAPVNPVMGQPAQQLFETPPTPPPPASTMQAMQQQGGWVTQGVHAVPNQSAAAAATMNPANVGGQQPAPAAQPARAGLQQEVNQFVKEAATMFGNNNQQQGQVQNQQCQQAQGPGFFDTTTGKVTLGVGGIGVGVLGTKLLGGIFGGGSNNSCSASDAGALASAFKMLLG